MELLGRLQGAGEELQAAPGRLSRAPDCNILKQLRAWGWRAAVPAPPAARRPAAARGPDSGGGGPHHLAEREGGPLGSLLSAQGFGGKPVASGGQRLGQPLCLAGRVPSSAFCTAGRPRGQRCGNLPHHRGSAIGGSGALGPIPGCSQGRAPVSCQDCPLPLREVGSLLTATPHPGHALGASAGTQGGPHPGPH